MIYVLGKRTTLKHNQAMPSFILSPHTFPMEGMGSCGPTMMPCIGSHLYIQFGTKQATRVFGTTTMYHLTFKAIMLTQIKMYGEEGSGRSFPGGFQYLRQYPPAAHFS